MELSELVQEHPRSVHNFFHSLFKEWFKLGPKSRINRDDGRLNGIGFFFGF